MALGMTAVIITGGIDLSVGSVMGLVAIVAGLFLTWHYPWYIAFAMGLVAGLACGAVNGFFVAYVGIPSFVVTLGMLSIARSLAVVFSANQMLYQFGPDAPIVKAIGQAKWPRQTPGDSIPDWIPQFSSHFWTMIALALIVGYAFNFKPWGRHLFAIGGNEQAARLTGVPVDWIKFMAYVFSAFTASLASLLLLGYNGSAINAMGQGYELRVIAATVIGGASLMGGAGTAFGAVIGSAFLEVIRNALLMAGIDSNWQGAFVGAFIILAVLLGHADRRESIIAATLERSFGSTQKHRPTPAGIGRHRGGRHMKKFLLTAAVALGALTVAVSAAQAKYVFALVPKNMNNPFFDQARDGCKKAEKELNGAIECMYIGPGEHGGGDEQVTIVRTWWPEGRRHRRVALQRRGHGGCPSGGQGRRHPGSHLGLRPLAGEQGPACRLHRHPQLRDRHQPRQARNADQAEGRHDLHPVGRRCGGQPQ
jgi:ribose transport system permease protein